MGLPSSSASDLVIIGAGPYGLSAAAYLRELVPHLRIFGKPMAFWRSMPSGLLLRSNWTATSIAGYRGPLSLDAYCDATGRRVRTPVPLEQFIEYGHWVQERAAPDLDQRLVTRVEMDRGGAFTLKLEDGEQLPARRVVVAGGIGPFRWLPPLAASLPRPMVSHTGDHRDLSGFADRRVLVVGGGQSALESAALIREAGGQPEVIVRGERVHWLHGGRYHRMLGRLAPLVYAPTDVGPMGLSRLVAGPDVLRRFPRSAQDRIASRAIRPAGAAWLVPRLQGIPIQTGRSVVSALPADGRVRVRLDDGQIREVDHLLFGTGYQIDIAAYGFLTAGLLSSILTVDGSPILRRGLESSVPGLHFLGAPAARSFGPIMRFVSGTWYAGKALRRAMTDVHRHGWAPGATSTAPDGPGARALDQP